MSLPYRVTDKVENLNGAGYATGFEKNPINVPQSNIPTDAMDDEWLRNCEEEGLINFLNS